MDGSRDVLRQARNVGYESVARFVPELKAGKGDQSFGLLDPVTVDTHVINSMALIIGKSYDAQAIMMQNLARLYNYMNGTDLTPRQLGLETAERTIAGRKIIQEANELIAYRQKQGFDVNTLARYKADAVSPQVNLTCLEEAFRRIDRADCNQVRNYSSSSGSVAVC